MSLPKRRIDVDPMTPVGDVTELLRNTDVEIEIRVGRRLFIVHRSDDENASVSAEAETATARLLAHAGAWKGNVDGEALKRQIYADRACS